MMINLKSNHRHSPMVISHGVKTGFPMVDYPHYKQKSLRFRHRNSLKIRPPFLTVKMIQSILCLFHCDFHATIFPFNSRQKEQEIESENDTEKSGLDNDDDELMSLEEESDLENFVTDDIDNIYRKRPRPPLPPIAPGKRIFQVVLLFNDLIMCISSEIARAARCISANVYAGALWSTLSWYVSLKIAGFFA